MSSRGVNGEAMRTDRTREAGGEVSDLDRPIWEERSAFDESDTADIERSPADAESDTADIAGIGYPDFGDDPSPPVQPPVPRSGRHQAPEATPAAGKAGRGSSSVRRRPRGRSDLVRTGVRGLGQTLITGGLVVLLFVVYELFITDLLTDQRQEELTDELVQNWEDDPTLGPDLPGGGLSEIPLGEGFAFIRIPALGTDYVRVVVEGTTSAALATGPGHYVESAMPGEVGNFSLAGHRTGKGSPFIDLDVLRPGDAVVIETVDTYFTYRVLGDPATGNFEADPSGIPGQEIVLPQDVNVVFPIPGVNDESVAPTIAYLTLTTCHPKFSNDHRLIIHAVLDGPGLSKADYPDGPPAMTEA